MQGSWKLKGNHFNGESEICIFWCCVTKIEKQMQRHSLQLLTRSMITVSRTRTSHWKYTQIHTKKTRHLFNGEWGTQNNGFQWGTKSDTHTARMAVKENESKNQIDGKHILCEHAARTYRLNVFKTIDALTFPNTVKRVPKKCSEQAEDEARKPWDVITIQFCSHYFYAKERISNFLSYRVLPQFLFCSSTCLLKLQEWGACRRKCMPVHTHTHTCIYIRR